AGHVAGQEELSREEQVRLGRGDRGLQLLQVLRLVTNRRIELGEGDPHGFAPGGLAARALCKIRDRIVVIDHTDRRRATAKALPKIATRMVQSAVGPKMRTAVAVRRIAVLAKYCTAGYAGPRTRHVRTRC